MKNHQLGWWIFICVIFIAFFVNNVCMKRFLFFTVLIAVIIGVMLYFTPQPACADIYSYSEYNAVVNIYCRKANCQALDLGTGYEVTCSVNNLKDTLRDCSGVDGFSATFFGSEQDITNALNRLHAKIVSVQQLDGLYVVCAYSSRLQGGVTLDGSRVNVQIAYNSGVVTVGYPLILGSY